MTRTQDARDGRGVRVTGLVLTVLVGVPFALLAWVAVSSRFGFGSGDPHGYALIFGTFFALIAGLVLAFVVPLMFRPVRRGSAYRASLIAYVAVAVGLILLLLTA